MARTCPECQAGNHGKCNEEEMLILYGELCDCDVCNEGVAELAESVGM